MEKIPSHRVLLIISNGFDIDLGLKTKYQDFVESSYFTDCLSRDFDDFRLIESNYDFNIFDYLQYKYDKNQGWIDVEHELAELATRQTKILNDNTIISTYPIMGKRQKESFLLLKRQLNKYLDNIKTEANKTSYAYRLLDIVNYSSFSTIISFNYTSLFSIDKDMSERNVQYYQVHGTLTKDEQPHIILGFQDDLDIDKSYCCMIKSHQLGYHSSRIPEYLSKADEIIFFGLSLGDVDYPYFSDFFKKQCIPTRDSRKIISFFTFDENSRQDILYQLRIMNDKRTRYFFEYNDLNFFRTKNKMDDNKIEEYFMRLREEFMFQ